MNNEFCNNIAYFVDRSICQYAYTSLFSSKGSNISIIYNGKQNEIVSSKMDYNFFEILPSIFRDLLTDGKSVLFLGIESLRNEGASICFYYPRETIEIKKNEVFSNGILVTDEKRHSFIEIKATKYITKLKYKKHLKKLSKISILPPNILSSINSGIPVDYTNYELEKNIFCLQLTKDLGGLFSYTSHDLHITGYYSYLREIKLKRLQYALFKNIVDEINRHFQIYKKDLGMDLHINIDSTIIEEINGIEEKMKSHETDLLSVGEILYKNLRQ